MIYSDMMATCQSKNHVILIKSDFITNQIKSSIIGAVSWPLSNFFNLGCYMPIQGRCGLCEPYIMLCDLICISLACWTWSNHLSDSSPPPWDWILLKGTLHLNEGYSHHQIQTGTHRGNGTIVSISKEVEGDRESHPGSHSSKLSSCDSHQLCVKSAVQNLTMLYRLPNS